MAKKDKAKIGNSKPTRKYRTRTLGYQPGSDIACGSSGSGTPGDPGYVPPEAGEETANAAVKLTDIIRYNHFEVGNTGSSFSGTDSYGNDIKALTFGEREPLMVRYNYIQEVDDYVDVDDDSFASAISSGQYYYEQDVEEREKLKEQVPRWEMQSRPFITYDEEYFQHIFNWPTAHTLTTRKVGGFLESTVVCPCTGQDQSGSSTDITACAVSTNFNGSFTLDKTKSEIYWIDDNYNYRKLDFDSESGRITGDEGVPENVNVGITIKVEWDDNPNTAGVAFDKIEWIGSGISVTRSGEKGSASKTVTLNAGDYMLKVSDNQGGFEVTNSGSVIELYDKDGTDANGKVKLSVNSSGGSGTTAKFDSKGNLTVSGTNTTPNPSKSSNFITDKIGDPVIYHGGTDDNAIFFNYRPENATTDTTNKKSTIVHVFDDPNDTTNKLTSSNSDVIVVDKSKTDRGGNDSSLSRKHYEVTIQGVNISSEQDITIEVKSNKSASGLRTANFNVSRIKLISNSKFLIWFEANSNVNSFVREWTVRYGESASNSAGSTSKPLSVGDTVNGHEIKNIVNYVVDVALKRTVSKSSNKKQNDPGISESKFLALGGTVDDYGRTNAYMHLNTVDDLVPGMQVFGDGVKDGSKITAVDNNNKRIYITKPLTSARPKEVRFADNAVNRISTHTLCYAIIDGSGSDFVADTEYTSDSGIKIVARAGYGIINRSAVVGIYYSKGRKNLQYSPIFYTGDPNCIAETDRDENNDYVLGTLRWEGNKTFKKYNFEDVWVVTQPRTSIAYKIASMFLSHTRAPITRDLFNYFYNIYLVDKNIIKLYGVVAEFCKTELAGLKTTIAYDSICRDTIQINYFQPYIPDLEVDDLEKSTGGINDSLGDDCLINTIEEVERNETEKTGKNKEIDEMSKVFQEILQKSVGRSTFLSDEYYKLLISNEDSMLNTIRTGAKNIADSTPDTQIEDLPPQVEGSDNSGRINLSDSYRALPPSMDRVKYFVEDLIISDDRFMNPILDLDPSTTINQPRLVIRSKPCWEWDDSQTTYTIPVTCGVAQSNIIITVNTDSDGYVTNIISNPDAVTTPGCGLLCTCTGAWKMGPKDMEDNLYMGERAESFGDGAYYEATNNSLPPDLRDLDYKDRSSDDDVSTPIPTTYPRVIWEPNVSYQMDFYKIFWFRLNELTELVGETLANFGNPYLDSPIRAKIAKTIQPSDTTIKVESTAGFLHSGYLSIPKYTKKIVTNTTGNNTTYFTYSGEELIYYSDKTDTEFTGCVREALSSSSEQVQRISVKEIENSVRYEITKLGDTDWESYGIKDPKVGDVFVAKGDKISGTGEVEIYGTNNKDTPNESQVFGATDSPRETIITSYERGFSVSQFWVDRLKEA